MDPKDSGNIKLPRFLSFYERLEHMRTKRRLKAAFARKPRPARVKPKDEND
jgi:hypothetical protein